MMEDERQSLSLAEKSNIIENSTRQATINVIGNLKTGLRKQTCTMNLKPGMVQNRPTGSGATQMTK